MVLFLLRKLILQTRMRSHLVALDVWYLVRPFVYFHTSFVRTAKALARLRGCAGSPEPSLVAYAISTIISCAGSFQLFAVVQEETTVKELFLPENHGGPAPHDGADGNSSNRSGDAERDRIEMVEMVPPSYNKNIAQVSDHIENATYIPTLARQKWVL